jgi:hypothetical protein
LAYILGEILELDHKEAAMIAGISPAAFRQRLARARKAIVAFTAQVCGIVDERNPCRCEERACFAVAAGRVQLGHSLFGEAARETATRFGDIKTQVRQLQELRRAVALYRSHPPFDSPSEARALIAELLTRNGGATYLTPSASRGSKPLL